MRTFGPSQGGFSLIEVLVTSALVGVVGMGALSLTKLVDKQQTQSNAVFQLSQVSRTVAQTVQNSAAWKATVNDKANATPFKCLNAGSCTSGTGGNFQVDGTSGTALNGWVPAVSAIKGAPPYYGFTQNGTPCSTFIPPTPPAAGVKGTNKGNDSCPFGLELTWTAVCPSSGACNSSNIQAQVNGVWSQNFGTQQRQLAFNGGNYNLQVFGGTTVTGGCTAGQVMTGMNQVTGSVTCTALSSLLPSGSCPSGEVMIGISSGSPVCGAVPTPTSTPATPSLVKAWIYYNLSATTSPGGMGSFLSSEEPSSIVFNSLTVNPDWYGWDSPTYVEVEVLQRPYGSGAGQTTSGNDCYAVSSGINYSGIGFQTSNNGCWSGWTDDCTDSGDTSVCNFYMATSSTAVPGMTTQVNSCWSGNLEYFYVGSSCPSGYAQSGGPYFVASP